MVNNAESNHNVVWHHATVTPERREKLNGHKSVSLWFTGLSGSGKSTLAHAVEERLHQLKCRTFVFDGDNVRHGLCGDLSFSETDRSENIRRIGEMIKLFLQAGVISLSAFISPLRNDRQKVREIIGPDNFIEIYCHCPLEVCEERDVKGLYQKARSGEIKNYTGISAPYEEPLNPDLKVNTSRQSLDRCVELIMTMLVEKELGIDLTP